MSSETVDVMVAYVRSLTDEERTHLFQRLEVVKRTDAIEESAEHYCDCEWCGKRTPSTDDLGKGKWQVPEGWSWEFGGELLCSVCLSALRAATNTIRASRKAKTETLDQRDARIAALEAALEKADAMRRANWGIPSFPGLVDAWREYDIIRAKTKGTP